MVINQITLECKRVRFYGPHDKDAFFEWVNKINCVTSIEGKGDTIVINIVGKKEISDCDLQSITALFRRYKINLSQLEILLNDNNASSFRNYKYGYSICVYPKKK